MDSTWLGGALGVAAALALVQTLRLAWREGAAGRRLSRTKEIAAAGEREAERLLRRAGYRIAGRQVRRKVTYVVDGTPREVDVRADLLVRRAGRELVAEVKTGDAAPKPTAVATRRQLLEYAHAFGVRSVLLVDATRGNVSEVTLPALPSPSRARPLAWALILALLAAAWLLLR